MKSHVVFGYFLQQGYTFSVYHSTLGDDKITEQILKL